MTDLEVRVAVAVICRNSQCFIAKRPDNVHQGGLWEFPGGKCELNETLTETLRRELREELGIEVLSFTQLISIAHSYPEKTVRLEICEVDRFTGEPSGCEGQETRWVPISALKSYQFPEANKTIVDLLVQRQAANT